MSRSVKRRVQKLARQKRRHQYIADYLEELTIRPHIAPVYGPLLDDIEAGNHSIYNLPGGRGSCKSSFIGLEITKGVMDDPTGESNAIIFRAVGETLRDSVFAQILWSIDTLEATDLWECTVKPMQCKFLPTGAVILFRGLDDPRKLKSIKPRQGHFRYVWFEEFCELAGEPFARSVVQSVVRGKGPKPIIFRSFNPPISANAWANQAVAKPDKRALTVRTTYHDVPAEWLGDAFIEEAERLKEVNPRAYEHEYEGKAVGTGSDVFENLEIRTITDEEAKELVSIYQGCDFGFSDPTAFIRAAYDRKTETIILLDEIYQSRMSNQALAAEIRKRGYQNWRITGDCADPRSIADLNAEGLYCGKCHKYAGCIQYRIRWLQHRKIVIDPGRTPNAHREFTEYTYKVDRNGVVLPELVEGAEHTVDALAYALNDQIYNQNNPA